MENSTGKPTTALPQSEEFSLLEKRLQDPCATPVCVTLDFLKSITSDFSMERELGRGGFGVVYKGILQNGQAIAVKKLIETHLNDAQFQNEATYLYNLKHQNIIELVGYCAESHWEAAQQVDGKYVMAEVRKRLLCFQYINNKSLDNHISVQSDGFGWRTRFDIIIGICSGLHYLHTECRIVHLDLKPQNILLDDHMEPKIADFGMSRLFGQQQSQMITKNRAGTIGYMAPEYSANGLISFKADIFSLGVIIMELMTGRRSYPSSKESYDNFVENVVGCWRKRLEESYKSVEIYVEQVKMCIDMGLKCVDTDPNKRPTARDIVDKLTKQDVMNMIKGPPEKQMRPQAQDGLWELEKIRPGPKNATRRGTDPSPSVPEEQVCPGPEDGAGTSGEDLSPSDQQPPGIFQPYAPSSSSGGQHQKLVEYDGPIVDEEAEAAAPPESFHIGMFKEAARKFKDGMAMVKMKIHRYPPRIQGVLKRAVHRRT